MSVEWTRQEPGWYTSELGGLYLERDGWWWFWSRVWDLPPTHRWRTLREAKRGVARLKLKAGA